MKFHKDGAKPVLQDNTVFVFGSNLSGIHGAGAAKEAKLNYGAEMGVGHGYVGNSYAIPTKGVRINFIPISDFIPYILEFVQFTKKRPDLNFFITRIGCGLAGFKDSEIAPLFKGCGENCDFPEQWKEFVE